MKAKKVLAMLMASVMIMGTSVTTFAAPDADPTTSNITVNGLAAEEDDTTVNLYPVVTWNEEESKWDVAAWAEDYIDTSANPYTIKKDMADELVAAVQGDPIFQTLRANTTQVQFENVPVGAYVITASGNSASYAPMVVETYKGDATYMEAEDQTVTAKTSGYELTKQQIVEAEGNKFVGRGEDVKFEVVTTFPSFEDPDLPDNSFKFIDIPSGLDITGVEKVTIGGSNITDQLTDSEKIEEVNEITGETTQYTIDLTKFVGETNANAGKTVTVIYTAKVVSDDGYSNTANTSRNDTSLGEDEEKGYTGDITITKKNDSQEVLNGAEFEVYHGTKSEVEAEGSKLTALSFVKISDGVYKLALPEEEGATTTVVATNGTVQVKGLEEGNYWFKETKAPEGYSINADGAPVEITKGEADVTSKNISKKADVTDTKLSELPSTGGIGTTIFTIGGCAIMVTAAGLYFATRKKTEK